MTLHFALTRNPVSYPYYLAVATACKVHRCDRKILWTTVEPEGPYARAIQRWVEIKPFYHRWEFPALDSLEGARRAAIVKDWIEWNVLAEHGGLFLDLDTLSRRDLTEYLGDADIAALRDVPEEHLSPQPFNNAVVLASEGSRLARKAERQCRDLLSQDSVGWGKTGPAICSEVMRCLEARALPFELGGALPYEDYHARVFGEGGVVPPDLRVLHCFARTLEDAFSAIQGPEYIRQHDNLYTRIVREVLTEEEWDVAPDLALGPTAEEWLALRGQHYRPLFEFLQRHPVRRILEVGTHDGQGALAMLRASPVPTRQMEYFGFDLFEPQDDFEAAREFSIGYHRPPDVETVRARIAASGARVTLVKGDTRKTLPLAGLPMMDLIYIDGGHSLETVASDWEACRRWVGPETVVFFDDYFEEMPFVGCQTLAERIRGEGFTVELCDPADDYPTPYGRLRTRLMRVTQRSQPATVKPSLPASPERGRFHLLGLAHLPTARAMRACAYTQKVWKLSKMLLDLGHEVILYGGEGSDAPCTEFVECVTEAERRACYGDYDWRKEFFRHDGGDSAHQAFNARAIPAILARKQPGDLLLCSMGTYQKPIADAVGMRTVESGIGYKGIFAPHKVFESYAWMHYLYGVQRREEGDWYDCVIPNYYNPVDFPLQEKKQDYFLYVGRIIPNKGVHLAAQVCERLRTQLVVAGQGKLADVGLQGSPWVRHVGTVDAEERARLMGGARALFAPTVYIEPFGGVAVEAQLCGTPAITTDWGVFPETVRHGVTGYRCRTMDDFLWAARNVGELSPQDCRSWAIQNYSMERVALMYEEYFRKLRDLDRDGWYQDRPERNELSWLQRFV